MTWLPATRLETLQLRAHALRDVREFFAERRVLEVDTPALIGRAVTDVNIHSAQVSLPGHPAPLFLQTSPEYAMKRLLAAGSGDIYQLAHVFRGDETSALHNAEFTLIEWYRCGYSLTQLMREVAQLAHRLLALPADEPYDTRSYSEAFQSQLACDPLSADESELRRLCIDHQLDLEVADRCGRDELLDWLMATVIGPRLGSQRLCFLHRYPLSQAALARTDPADARVALRFELYHHGIELANGFEELASVTEQRARFEADQRERARRGLPAVQIDERLLQALTAGLPEVAGVAVGFDRLLMLRVGAASLSEVLPFPLERA